MSAFSELRLLGGVGRRPWVRRAAGGAVLLVCAWLAWPYVTLWQLEHAAVTGDHAMLERMVDIDAVRDEISRRLNKDMDSDIGEVSNAFVDWLQQGVTRLGSKAVDVLVTIDWVRERLLAKQEGEDDGFLRHIGYAFFESPGRFRVRIGPATDDPVFLVLQFEGFRWRVVAVYG